MTATQPPPPDGADGWLNGRLGGRGAHRTSYIPGPVQVDWKRFVVGPDDTAPDPSPIAEWGNCDGCPAPAVTALARVGVGPHPDWPRSYLGVQVQTLLLCGHHGDTRGDSMESDGWIEVGVRRGRVGGPQ